MIQNPLCVLPSEPSGGCCDPPAQPPSAPLVPYNPPGLSIIKYRIGTFSSFRRAMLDEVADSHLLDLLDGAVNPFASWHEVVWRNGSAPAAKGPRFEATGRSAATATAVALNSRGFRHNDERAYHPPP